MRQVGVGALVIECPINIGTLSSYVKICWDGANVTFEDNLGNPVGGITGGTGGSGCCEPLTNGDVDNPELIFAGGDVIMVDSI